MALENYSGFGGFGMANIYPNWGMAPTQSAETKVDKSDDQVLNTTEETQNLVHVDAKQSKNFWILLAVIVVLIVMFGIPK